MSRPQFLLDEPVWGGLVVVGQEIGADVVLMVADWFLAGRDHWGVIIAPGQTHRSFLSQALRNIYNQFEANSLKNSFRFIQDFV